MSSIRSFSSTTHAEMIQLTPKDPDQFIAIISRTHLLCCLLVAHHSGICNSISWLLWESTQKCIMGTSGSKSSRFLLLFVCLQSVLTLQKSTKVNLLCYVLISKQDRRPLHFMQAPFVSRGNWYLELFRLTTFQIVWLGLDPSGVGCILKATVLGLLLKNY